MQQVLQASKAAQLNADGETLQQAITRLSQELGCANKQVREKQYAINAMEEQLQQLNQQLQVKTALSPIEQRSTPPMQSMPPTPHQQSTPSITQLQLSTPMTPPQSFKQCNKLIQDIKWCKCDDAPEKMWRGSAVSKGRMACFNHLDSTTVHTYNSETQQWSSLPDCPYKYTTLVFVANTLLTAVGGRKSGKPINSLHSLVGSFRNRKWAEYFPPMPTKRYLVAAVFSGKYLIVAGGHDGNESLSIVEVLDIEWLQWSNASRLPQPFYWAAAVLCGDRLFLLGGIDQTSQTRSVMTCSVSELLQPQLLQALSMQQGKPCTIEVVEQPSVWHQAANTPFNLSTCAIFNGQVVAVGGYRDSKNTAAVFVYDSTADSWQATKEMTTARYRPLVTELPGHQLMVVGGWGECKHTATVEIATTVDL